MKAAIVTIGEEILIGQITDTNSAFIAGSLNSIGIRVYRIVTISDNKEEIFRILDELIPIVNVIILTGGLGPTSDDITKSALAEYFKSKLVFNELAYSYLTSFLKKRNTKISERNNNQAFLPEDCIPVPNKSGTAMGMWFNKNEKIIISMPGVPYEMKEMMTQHIIPKLNEIFSLLPVFHKTVLTTGIPESVMADKISIWENNLTNNITLAYLPSPGILRLRLTTILDKDHLLIDFVNQKIDELRDILGNAIFGFDNDKLEEVVGELLKAKKSTLSMAESCTGGLISHLITSIPGSSKFFKGEITAYSNGVKADLLNVDQNILEKFGAVSKQVVVQMAENVRSMMKTDYSVAVSGIAGPDGGTPEKPVGTVWIAVSSGNQTNAEEFHFGDNRERNIRRAALAALNMLRLQLLENN